MFRNVLKVTFKHGNMIRLNVRTYLIFCVDKPFIKNSLQALQFHTSGYARKKYAPELSLMVFKDFENKTDKTKNSYLDMIHLYEDKYPQRRGHVEFIYAALKHMKDYGVDKDLTVYKALIDVMPKGKMIPTNMFQVEFMHYPKQQQCIIDLLEKMEDNGVIPDTEMETMLVNVFGNHGFPLRKYWRMMYWMPKFKNLSPWKLPNPTPDDALELAKLAVHRMTSVDLRTVIDIYQCEDVLDSIDKTWIVSGVSPAQLELLENHKEGTAVIVEGGSRVWLRSKAVSYFVLKAEATPRPKNAEIDIDDVSNLKVPYFNTTAKKEVGSVRSVHEQDDGIIYGICATGTSSKDSALSWVRLLQRFKAPKLEKTPVLFRFRQPTGELVPFSDSLVDKQSIDDT